MRPSVRLNAEFAPGSVAAVTSDPGHWQRPLADVLLLLSDLDSTVTLMPQNVTIALLALLIHVLEARARHSIGRVALNSLDAGALPTARLVRRGPTA